MAVLNKSDIPAHVLPKETVTVEELGGDVVVSALTLSENLEMAAAGSEVKPYTHMARMLSAKVTDAAGLPIKTAEEWEAWGGVYTEAALRIVGVVLRLSGKTDTKKNSPPLPDLP